MQTTVALLRGINVGGNNLLPMAELVKLLTDLGLEDVKTYIQSGNVVFSNEPCDLNSLSEQISSTINAAKGFKPRILLLSKDEFLTAIKNCPFDEDEGKLLHYFFLESIPENPDLELLASVQVPTESFQIRDKVFYLHAPEGIGRSKLVGKAEKALGVPATARNWNTVRKIQGYLTDG